MKKIYVVIVCVCMSFVLHAQALVDPSDPFYSDVAVWQLSGVIKNIPNVRPYPLPVVKEIIQTVLKNGTQEQRNRATYYKQLVLERKLFPKIAFKNTTVIPSFKDIENRMDFLIGVEGNGQFGEFVSAEYNMQIPITNNAVNVWPHFQHNPVEFSGGYAKFPLNFSGDYSVNALVTIGTPKWYVTAGASRGCIGPFFSKSIVLGSHAPQNISLSYHYETDYFSFTQQVLSIQAGQNNGDSIWYSKYANEKYIAIHTITLHLFSWLDFGYFEVANFGQRLDFGYFTPAPFMVVQAVAGLDDNCHMGIEFKIHPLKNLHVHFTSMVDDISINELAKFDLDTKIIASGIVGVSWTPQNPIVESLSVDYTLINAYMYSHEQVYKSKGQYEGTDFNYLNYGHRGVPVGSNLQPNTGRLSIASTLKPFNNCSIKFFADYIHHGNINESLDDTTVLDYLKAKPKQYATDGSISNYPYIEGKGVFKEYQTRWMFLQQPHIEHILQTGLSASYDIILGKNHNVLKFSMGYVFEYIHNPGVEHHMYPGLNKTDATLADVYEAKNRWIENLGDDQYNHYINFSVKYMY